MLFALPLLIFEVTGEASKSGVAFFFEWMPAVLLMPFLGVLVDRWREQWMYVGGDTLRALVCLSGFALLFVWPRQTFIVLTLLMAMLAILDSLNFMVLETTIARRFAEAEIPRLQSWLQGVELTSEIIAPALAGILVYSLAKSSFLLLAAVVFFVSGLGFFGLPRAGAQAVLPKRSFNRSIVRELKMGIRLVVGVRPLLLLIVLTLLCNFLIATFMTLNPAIAVGALGVSASQYAWIGLCGGVAGATVLFCVPCLLRFASLQTLGKSALVSLVTAGVVAGSTDDFFSYVAAYAILSCGIGVLNVFLRTERVPLIPKEHFGKAMGVISFVNRLSLPVAGLVVAIGTRSVSGQQLLLGVAVASGSLLFALLAVYLKEKQEMLPEKSSLG